MTALADKLCEARALIDTPEKWTQGMNALNGDGHAVLPTSPGAVCFCPQGALIRAYGGPPPREAYKSLRGAYDPAAPGFFLSSWNDRPGRTHAQVLAAFDRAIEAAQATT